MNTRRLPMLMLFLFCFAVNGISWLWLHSGTGARVYASSLTQEVVTAQVAATIPKAFSYQGTLRLADGKLATGAYNMSIRLYDAVTGGNQLFAERFDNVAVRDGIFNLVLGDKVALPENLLGNGQLFLGVTVEPDPEMLPRQRIHPVPWALNAATAQSALTAGTADTATSANQTSAIRESGDGKGGAKQRQDYPVTLQRYVVEARDNGVKPFSVPVDDALLVQLCGDEDGCSLTLGTRNPTVVTSDNRFIMSFPYLFALANPANGGRFWHAAGFDDAGIPVGPSGTDGANNSQNVISSGDCRFTDGAFADGVDQGDIGPGFAVLNWWGHDDSAEMVCVLVIND